MAQIIFCILAGALVTAAIVPLFYLALKRRSTYTALTIDDQIDYFQQVNQEKLVELAGHAQCLETIQPDQTGILLPYGESSLHTRKLLEVANHRSYDYRRHLRLNLDLLKDYTQRMLHNAARPGHVAYSDLCKMKKHKLVYTAEEINAINETIDAVKAFRKCARSVHRKTWFWSVIRFEERAWGPIPNFANFEIQKMMAAYNRVKQAAEAYALFYGDVGKLISEEIRVKM